MLFTKCPACGRYSFLDRDCCKRKLPKPKGNPPTIDDQRGNRQPLESWPGTIESRGFAR